MYCTWKWFEHVVRMNDERRDQKLLEDKTGVQKKILIPKLRWMDDFQMDLRYMSVEPRKTRGFDRTEWEGVMMKGKDKVKRLKKKK
jgi:hypothetical protein